MAGKKKTPLDRFISDGQRIEVIADGHPLKGFRGTVTRRRMGDDGAWITLDTPANGKPFPKCDDLRDVGDGKKKIMLYPDECGAA